MGPWPEVRALIDAIEDAEHGIHHQGGKSLETLNAAYNTMLARCPTPRPPLQHTTPPPQESPPRQLHRGEPTDADFDALFDTPPNVLKRTQDDDDHEDDDSEDDSGGYDT